MKIWHMIISSSRLILITVLDGKSHAMIPSDVKNEDLINQTLQLIKHCGIKCLIKLPSHQADPEHLCQIGWTRRRRSRGRFWPGPDYCISADCDSVPHWSEPESEQIFSLDPDLIRSLIWSRRRTRLPVTGGLVQSTRTERISFYWQTHFCQY